MAETQDIRKSNSIPIGYKQTAVGVIPEDWEIDLLANLGIIYTGGTPSTSIEKYWDGEIIWYTPSEISKAEKYVSESNRKITNDGLSNSSAKLFPENTIIVCTRATIGELAISTKQATTNQGFKSIYANNDVDTEFLYYQLLNQKEGFIRKSSGSTFLELSTTDFRNYKIPLPPLPEQQKIAEILSTWDEAITLTKTAIEEIKLRNKGLAQQLLTGKKRLNGFNRNWKEVKADKIFKNHTDKTHNGELEVLSATQENGVIPRSMNNIDIKFDASSLNTYKKVEKGDFVISLRSFQGGIEYSEYEGIVSPAYTVLKEIIPISKTFYKIFLKTETFINRLNTIIYGIRDGKQIGFKDFSTLKLPCPSLEEQEAIAEILEAGISELTTQQQKLKSLQQQKKGLMQKLLTGEVRVKID